MSQTASARPLLPSTTRVRPDSRPSAARAAAAARLVAPDGAAALALRPERTGSPWRHLRVVEAPTASPAQRRRRRRILLGSAAVLAVVVAFGLVYLHVVLAQRQFRVDQLNARVQQDQLTYQKLRLQVAELASPEQIISTAEGKLGMVQPGSVTYLTAPVQAAAAAGSVQVGGGSSLVLPGTTAGGSTSATTQAPEGDADWPSIKSQLAGSP
jgi:cell division protein FtsL